MKRFASVFVALMALITISTPAAAYVGPGAGLTAIGSFLALLAGIVVAVFGFVWFPLKRLLSKKNQAEEEVVEDDLEPETSQKQDQ